MNGTFLINKRLVWVFFAMLAFILAGGLLSGTAYACNHDSDCGGRGLCRNKKCGVCNQNSDCGGEGLCKNRKCGGCNQNSDCPGKGRCSNKQCSNVLY